MNYFIYSMLAFFNFFSKPLPLYENLSNEIIEQHRKEILAPRNMRIYGLGGSNDKGIKTIGISTAIKGPGSIIEGRRILLFLVDDLLEKYNSDVRIRPYLKNYPFTVENISYTISYEDERGCSFILQNPNEQDRQLAFIAMYNGKISYNIVLSCKMEPYTEIHGETYEEAKKILEEENRQSR